MGFVTRSPRSLSGLCQRVRPSFRTTASQKTTLNYYSRNQLFTGLRRKQKKRSSLPLVILSGGFLTWLLYPTDDFAQLSSRQDGKQATGVNDGENKSQPNGQQVEKDTSTEDDDSAWASFARRFEFFSATTDQEWPILSADRIADFILPDWWKIVPGYMRKLQRELSMSPGSLADEIWTEAHDPSTHPEIEYSAKVRVSNDLCTDEKQFLERRKKYARIALAKYLNLKEKDIHPDDVPTIAMGCSGGGLRALIAGTGSFMATEEDGLFDCVTYTAGVSGSCWLQLLYLTSFTQGHLGSLVEHLKARASTHIAYPPTAFDALTSMPTNKLLLSGVVEKLKGDPKADFGLVDIYGLLLGARFLVPKGELAVDEQDFKISNQRRFLKYGQVPLPIYTAVRHEIPDIDDTWNKEAAKEKAKKESWFQWFEMTPYEFFCEEFGAGIPTWAAGRVFENGKDVPPERGFHLPELRTPFLMGIFGSAFCATLSHYYNEIRPIVSSITGFKSVDELISGRDDDLSKVHPIDPAIIPNFIYKMNGQLPSTTPKSVYEREHIQLMDAGMSNNLPIYPLLRPGRDVDVIIAFDASADTRAENWLSVADGFARQRGVKGWPIGIGWPKSDASVEQTTRELNEAQAKSVEEADRKLSEAQLDQKAAQEKDNSTGPQPAEMKSNTNSDYQEPGDLSYCNVWVGTTAERTTSGESSPSSSKSRPLTSDDSWKLMEPDAGLSIIYLPFMGNEKVADISPGVSDYLSTWNFIYTPEQIDKVVELARANYGEGKEQIKATVRAVYERKKKLREAEEKKQRGEMVRKAFKRDGDQFS